MITLDEALNLAIDHQQSGRLTEATDICRQILDVDPRYANASYLWGRVEFQQGRYAEAEALFRRAISAGGTDATFQQYLGEALRAQEEFEPAIAAYREALRLQPDYALAYANLGLALVAIQDAQGAETAYREALRLRPDLFATDNNLGVLLRDQRRWPEARACFDAALQVQADCFEAHNNLGNLLRDEDKLSAAIDAYRRALAINPDYAPAHFNLANALKRAGQNAAAAAEYEHALRLNPSDAQARTNLAAALQRLGRLDEAVAECERAIALRPDLALAHNNLGSCMHARGQIEDALPHFRKAVELSPEDGFLQSNLAHALNYAPGIDAQAIFEEHVRWGRRHADTLAPVARAVPDRSPARRVRIGYVSAYFREHAISVFTEPLLAAHDHRAFEVTCYSDVRKPDAVTSRFRSSADRWIDTSTLSDTALAERIAADQVDILVDLTGHLEGNRLLTFARRPAPIQVTYIGYQNTTGMQAMDYRLTDAWSDPQGTTDRFYTEKLVRLPRAFFCYRPADDAPPASALPARTTGGVTFGSFNKLAKITTEVLSAWAQILFRVPNSRLLVLADPSDAALARMRSAFAAHGVAGERLEFVGKRPRREYLELHQQVDIVLDTFPFNGHTTVCEALWMGVPVIVLAGETYVSRFGGSALVNMDLQDLIATSTEGYIETAVQLAGDLDRLPALRATLRERMLASPLLDAAGFTRNLEDAYRQMWTRWCSEPV